MCFSELICAVAEKGSPILGSPEDWGHGFIVQLHFANDSWHAIRISVSLPEANRLWGLVLAQFLPVFYVLFVS